MENWREMDSMIRKFASLAIALAAVAFGRAGTALAQAPTPGWQIHLPPDPGNHFFHGEDLALVIGIVVAFAAAIICPAYRFKPLCALAGGALVLGVSAMLGYHSPLTWAFLGLLSLTGAALTWALR